MPRTELIIYRTDTQRENAHFQQTTSNKCWQLLATCCNSSVRLLPEPRELPQPTRANFVWTSNLCKSMNPQCGHIDGRIMRCWQFTPAEITVLHVTARKVIFRVVHVLPVVKVDQVGTCHFASSCCTAEGRHKRSWKYTSSNKLQESHSFENQKQQPQKLVIVNEVYRRSPLKICCAQPVCPI